MLGTVHLLAVLVQLCYVDKPLAVALLANISTGCGGPEVQNTTTQDETREHNSYIKLSCCCVF